MCFITSDFESIFRNSRGVENKYVQWNHNILLNGTVLFSNEAYMYKLFVLSTSEGSDRGCY